MASVCPFNGSEIPDWQQLGLDPNRVCELNRDPIELAKAAATFDGVPLSAEHEATHPLSSGPEWAVGAARLVGRAVRGQ
jgi:hypothetical protein